MVRVSPMGNFSETMNTHRGVRPGRGGRGRRGSRRSRRAGAGAARGEEAEEIRRLRGRRLRRRLIVIASETARSSGCRGRSSVIGGAGPFASRPRASGSPCRARAVVSTSVVTGAICSRETIGARVTQAAPSRTAIIRGGRTVISANSKQALPNRWHRLVDAFPDALLLVLAPLHYISDVGRGVTSTVTLHPPHHAHDAPAVVVVHHFCYSVFKKSCS